jgi:hypothetical protein
MAKKRRGTGENMSAYFRKVFAAKPQWLQQKSNDDVVARYRADHSMGPNVDVGTSVKQTMANVKSILRKEAKGKTKSKAGATGMAQATGKPHLETLEELIDDCLVTARGLGKEELEHVIRLLRRARNAVVWKLGQKD